MTGNVEIFTEIVEVVHRKNIFDFKHVEQAQRNEEKTPDILIAASIL